MKRYQVVFEDKSGLVVGLTTIEAKNLKEARNKAQEYKRKDLLIFMAKGVKTVVLPSIDDPSVLRDIARRH